MTTATVVDTARSALGTVGVYLPLPVSTATAISAQREAVGRLERAGYQAAWTNEPLGGKDALVQLGILLAETKRMTFGTGIANIWARPPQTAHGASALLAEAYPGRFVLGLGVGYPAAGSEHRPGIRQAAHHDAQLPGPDGCPWHAARARGSLSADHCRERAEDADAGRPDCRRRDARDAAVGVHRASQAAPGRRVVIS